MVSQAVGEEGRHMHEIEAKEEGKKEVILGEIGVLH